MATEQEPATGEGQELTPEQRIAKLTEERDALLQEKAAAETRYGDLVDKIRKFTYKADGKTFTIEADTPEEALAKIRNKVSKGHHMEPKLKELEMYRKANKAKRETPPSDGDEGKPDKAASDADIDGMLRDPDLLGDDYETDYFPSETAKKARVRAAGRESVEIPEKILEKLYERVRIEQEMDKVEKDPRVLALAAIKGVGTKDRRVNSGLEVLRAQAVSIVESTYNETGNKIPYSEAMELVLKQHADELPDNDKDKSEAVQPTTPDGSEKPPAPVGTGVPAGSGVTNEKQPETWEEWLKMREKGKGGVRDAGDF